MLTGKPNRNWIGRMDELELPAGTSFDKTAAWEKLQQRLAGKKRRRFTGWTISSAAAILVLVSLFMFKQEQREITPIPAISWPIAPLLVTGIPTKTTAPEITSPAVIVANKKEDTPISPVSEVNVIKVTAAGNSVTIIKADTAIVAPPVAKKKMSVVHNNELEPTAYVITPKKNTASAPDLLAGYRKHEDLIIELTDTVAQPKPRKKLLPFSIISQKQ